MAADLKSKINNIPVVNEGSTDPLAPYQDAQHTTLENVIRLVTIDKYTPSAKLDNLQQGIVLKIVENPNVFEYSQKQELEDLISQYQNAGATVKKLRYKVFVLGDAGSHFTIPKNLEDPAIMALDEYTVRLDNSSESFEPATFKLGEIVFVDIKKRTIEYSSRKTIDFSDITSDDAVEPCDYDTIDASAPFNDIQGALQMMVLETDTSEDVAYEKGKKLGKINLKPIYSYSKQKLREDVADSFNKMVEDAKKEGVAIVASSGFRDMSTQIRLYNDRFVNKYPSPKKGNKLTANGERIGVAAYPGTSNHQNGRAVDIDLGKHKAEKNRYAGEMGKHPTYKWLVKNASKYGFDNEEGKKVNEPWHWVYNKMTVHTLPIEVAMGEKADD